MAAISTSPTFMQVREQKGVPHQDLTGYQLSGSTNGSEEDVIRLQGQFLMAQSLPEAFERST